MRRKQSQTCSGKSAAAETLRLEFRNATANSVNIAGTFNDWRPESIPMVSMDDGLWLKELVLPPGAYEYLFVVDGQWVPDPAAKEYVPNPFGGMNCIVRVPDRHAPTAL